MAPQADPALAEDVLDGLTRPAKELSPKYFYDERGSRLFDEITAQPEYYPTRAERAILEARAGELVALTGAGELVELGSGTATKTRVLLDAMRDAGTLRRYVAFDVDPTMVAESVAALKAAYPGVEIDGVAGDFDHHLTEIPEPEDGVPRVVAFLGGTVGNFEPGSRRGFLRALADLLRPEDRLLLGTDLIKDVDVLEAAYNDAAGVTAEFNRNVLLVLNRELDADFDPELFDHVAFFDPQHEWIEMRLRANREHQVRVAALDLDISFARGEEMRTELSTKFTRERLEADLDAAGLALAEWMTDPDDLYALSLSAPASA
ncbi:MAG: L-histidine N(alpha)-methyltransferase [uncultured Solirubrobacteraceae bacterium]|uniref:L-histidine N(Alpha)-methyltransferase n=1 Tax=uncultured Solirubrobacteraceae bacterium TaxID=1162706 RepID=A0A6J4S0L3_9ACTN|nr:MAG: L-histidine N(alpha)-methyltransferase [uncultured Solirubrobacteraceae bacterium]